MGDASLVRQLEPFPNLERDIEGFLQLQGALLDLLLQRRPIHVGHGQENLALPLVDFVNGADVRMVKRRRSLCLVEQPPAQGGVRHRIRGQKLQCHDSAQPRVPCLVDNAHPALAELLLNLVVRDGLANHGCSQGRRVKSSRLPCRSIIQQRRAS